jgi:hypothetical protein
MRCWSKTTFKYIDVIVAKFYAGGISSQDRPDEHFTADMAANVMEYFNISIEKNRLLPSGFKLGRALRILGRTLQVLRDK